MQFISEHIEWDAALLRFGGDSSFLMDVLHQFGDYAEEVFNKLAPYIKSADYEQIRHLAHNLKGSAATVGAQKVFSVIEAMEQSAKSGSLGQIEVLFSELRENITAFKKALGEIH